MKEFSNIESFVEHLGKIAATEAAMAHRALEKCAKVVEKRAKQKIGEYQEQVGPFIAWPELAESTKRDREAQGYSENEPGLRSGEMRESIGHVTSISAMETQIGSNDDKMVFFELGTSKQPPRSALGGAMAESLPKIEHILGEELLGMITATKVSAALLGDGAVEGGIEIEG
jgi:HK97 gp10 family phage protein